MSFQELGLGLSSISTLDRAMDRFLLALDPGDGLLRLSLLHHEVHRRELRHPSGPNLHQESHLKSFSGLFVYSVL